MGANGVSQKNVKWPVEDERMTLTQHTGRGSEHVDIARHQRRTIIVLAVSTILGGLGIGAAVSVGALLLAEVSGNEAISGLASTMSAAGAAIAGVPLARIAARRGRRPALVFGTFVAMLGALLAIVASAAGMWILLMIALGLLGVANAVQLLARFAATDLASRKQQARDLSLVVWSITVGAVVGPNLTGPGTVVGEFIGVPPLSGAFVFAFIAQAAAAIVVWVWLRPDPLQVALARAESRPGTPNAGPEPETSDGDVVSDRISQVLTIIAVAVAHAVMVAIMAMTPLHIMHHDGTPELVGFTISLHIAGMFGLAPVFGILASRYGRLTVNTLGYVILLVSTAIAFIAGGSHILVQIALTLLGLGWSAVTVAGAALITEITAVPERPKVQGLTDTWMNAAGAVAGALAGIIFAFGNFSFLAVGSALLLVVGIVASGILSVRLKRSQRVD